MKAVVCFKYGSPEALSIKEFDIPIPKDNELLVRVRATTVNRTDCGLLWGKPLILRLFTGLSKPKTTITGTDFAGQTEAVGNNVTTFKVGDKVMGFDGMMGLRSHAEYLTIPESKAIKMPGNITYQQAAACMEGALYAITPINRTKPKPGQKALVNGATGAIGSAIVQFLRYYGVYITAVCGTENIALVKSLGANKIIDYKTSDFTKDTEKYDFVFDAVSKSTFAKCKPLLTKNGIYIPSDLGPWAQNPFLVFITGISGGKKVIFPLPKDYRACMDFIIDLVEKGKFRPVIDRIYMLNKIADAYTYVATGQKTGNVIITMAE